MFDNFFEGLMRGGQDLLYRTFSGDFISWTECIIGLVLSIAFAVFVIYNR